MEERKYMKLMNDYAENYMPSVYYFCLKRTGSVTEAEDLSQDIAKEVLSSLQNGNIPEQFSPWVWKIARNRYSKWADKKHKSSSVFDGCDISDIDIAEDRENPENLTVKEEQLSLLRRELAFIKKDFREIISAYYIDNMSIKEISDTLHLTESAVKKRLERARNHLKEGIGMARTFGKLSYKPENISFINNGFFGSHGEPWNYLTRSLCKNIMLAAYRCPSTAQELALELGVALPYMEEELECLVDATLMRKNMDRYETACFIVSAELQKEIVSHLGKIADELTDCIIATLELETKLKDKYSSTWHEGYQPYEDMKWALLMLETDKISNEIIQCSAENEKESSGKIGQKGYTLRPNNGQWDIIGMEEINFKRPCFVGVHSCLSSRNENTFNKVHFLQYKFMYKGIADKTPYMLTGEEGEALVAAAKNDVSGIYPTILEKLERDGYLTKKNGTFIPTFLVMSDKKIAQLPQKEQDEIEQLREKAKRLAKQHYEFCKNELIKEIPDFLKNDAHQIHIACKNLCELKGAVLESALKVGYISYEENGPVRMLGAILNI